MDVQKGMTDTGVLPVPSLFCSSFFFSYSCCANSIVTTKPVKRPNDCAIVTIFTIMSQFDHGMNKIYLVIGRMIVLKIRNCCDDYTRICLIQEGSGNKSGDE